MSRTLWLLMAAAFVCSCGYESSRIPPLAPTPPSVPATITVTATPGAGGSAGQVFLAANVRDASGRGVGSVTVRFTTTSGVVQPDAVMTDGGGLAQTTVRTSTTATIEATAGSAKSAIEVTPVVVVPPTPIPPPVVPPSTGGPTVQPLSVTINAQVARAFATSTFALSVNNNAYGLAQEAWTFGDGGTLTTSTHTASHVYTVAAPYTVGVTVTDTQGRTASASIAIVIDAPPPTDAPTTPTTGLAITLGCKPATHGTPTPCNIAAIYNGQPVSSTVMGPLSVDWDWGDGTAQITGPVASRTYTQAGTYLVVPHATVNTVDGPKMATTSLSITVP